MHPIRILLAKIGLDGHDRGVKIIARLLRDAGMEVIYAGLHNTPEQVVSAAIEEDVDVLGVSLLSGAHMTIVPRVLSLLRQSNAEDMPVVVGGVIPDEDVAQLLEAGVAAVIDQDAPAERIPDQIREIAALGRNKAGSLYDRGI